MFRPFAKQGDLSKNLLETTVKFLQEENEKHRVYDQMLEQYGIANPLELSEQNQLKFFIESKQKLGENYSNPTFAKFKRLMLEKKHVKEASNQEPNIQMLSVSEEGCDDDYEDPKGRKLLKGSKGSIKEKVQARMGMKQEEPTETMNDVKTNFSEEQIDEVITKKTPAGDIIKDFIKSKNPKFAGKSKEERQKMALGAYYSKHPEKSKKKVK